MKIYDTIGVMSGTSLDGVDLAYIRFTKEKGWQFEIIEAVTYPYRRSWKQRLSDAIDTTQAQVEQLNQEYTKYLGELILKFIEEYQIHQIDAVCSHGHTIWHQPHKGYTLQIGNLPELAAMIGQKVVCDFRVQDVALGGQGAPLVPIGDELLFSDYDACINLGGFANISMEEEGRRLAFDICPVNIVMNHYCKEIGLEYDDSGRIAASGTISNPLLNELNSLPFYKKNAPKSLGLEWVKEKVFPLIDSYDLSVKDILCTMIAHVAYQMERSIGDKQKVLVTGGGAYNAFLVATLKRRTDAEIHIPAPMIIEYKEALVFGLLGVLRIRNEINVLSAVTGATKDHVSGFIFH